MRGSRTSAPRADNGMNRKRELRGKTYEEIYGTEKANEIKEKLRNAQLGRKHSDETRTKLSEQKIGHKNPRYDKPAPNRGISPSLETRKKMSLAHKGRTYLEIYGEEKAKEVIRKMSNANKNQIPWIKNKHHKIETRLKISEKLKGDKTHLWKGGISFESYTPEFNKNLKEKIRLRDGYICQECGIPQKLAGRKLYIHHIDYNKKNNSIFNLLSLCLSCHAKTNFNREYWKQKYTTHIQIKIEEIFLPYALLEERKFDIALLEPPKE